MMQKSWNRTEILAHILGTQQELPNEYQHDMV